MAGLSRRDFLHHAGGASAALAFMAANGIKLDASPLGLPIGSQAWPHRTRIGDAGYAGLEGLLKDMKAIGIDSIELISPSGPFSSLTDGKQVKKLLDDNGMISPSAHFRGVRTNLPTLIQWAHDIDMTYINMASMSGPVKNGVTTLDAVRRTCDEYNKLGATAKQEGLQMMTHNEGFENSRLDDGRLTYPVLLEHLDPEMMKMQFQMSSMRTVGNPVTYFTLYPGRFHSAHLQGVDLTGPPPAPRGMTMPIRPPAGAAAGGRGGGRGRGGSTRPALGEDSVDWVAVFTAAKTGGMQNYFIEMGWDVTVRSAAFLKTLNV